MARTEAHSKHDARPHRLVKGQPWIIGYLVVLGLAIYFNMTGIWQ